MGHIDLHDPSRWNRAKQIAWIHAAYRKQVWLKWTDGRTGWLTATPAATEIQLGRARLLRLA